jgi:hypothetical protein
VDLDGVESKDDAPDTSYYQVCKTFLSFYHRNLNFLFHPINHNGAKSFFELAFEILIILPVISCFVTLSFTGCFLSNQRHQLTQNTTTDFFDLTKINL